ncbi:MAG TPA: exonuclease SbcCD subunit D C-terminal domain-containing protein [Candidatus Ozemobacteraceae bacterium]|nr:exonuclease SbcCD subunit D C-terminal domain-containing protein [Candidatus Ozemobacteraceae bacterium]
MKILHTSDWHLGQTLIDVKRDEEHRAFVAWLLDIVREHRIEVVLVAGDIFDNGMPGNQTLEIYYSFLAQAASAGCRQVIVVGGNHDSPSTLHAPRAILQRLNVTVVGAVSTECPDALIVPLHDDAGTLSAVVCAVPFLRDRDVYLPKLGENDEERAKGIVTGIAHYYEQVAERADNLRRQAGKPDAPIIATGHLFARGGITGEKERPIYIGNLGAFPAERFPKTFSYVALGHLHRPQLVENHARIRYSGSPLPLAFDEIGYDKQVIVFDTLAPADPQPISVKTFRKLYTIAGDLPQIERQVREIASHTSSDEIKPLVQASYTGTELLPDLAEQVSEFCENLPLRCFTLNRSPSKTVATEQQYTDIRQLTPHQVFERRLESETLSEADRKQVTQAFDEIIAQLTTGEPS